MSEFIVLAPELFVIYKLIAAQIFIRRLELLDIKCDLGKRVITALNTHVPLVTRKDDFSIC